MKKQIARICATLILGSMLTGCAKGTGSKNYVRPAYQSDSEIQYQTPAEGAPTATIVTSMGTIKAVLYPTLAPMAVENFIGLAQQGYFNGIKFHRVVKDFVVQSGDATGTGEGGASIWNNNPYATEITDKLHHYSGALSMAHPSGDTTQNLSQFYIVQTPKDNIDKTLAEKLTAAGVREAVVSTYKSVGGAPYLDNLNTVFGQIYRGMNVIDAIGNAECNDNDQPLEDILIESVTIGAYSAAAEAAELAAAESQAQK